MKTLAAGMVAAALMLAGCGGGGGGGSSAGGVGPTPTPTATATVTPTPTPTATASPTPTPTQAADPWVVTAITPSTGPASALEIAVTVTGSGFTQDAGSHGPIDAVIIGNWGRIFDFRVIDDHTITGHIGGPYTFGTNFGPSGVITVCSADRVACSPVTSSTPTWTYTP